MTDMLPLPWSLLPPCPDACPCPALILAHACLNAHFQGPRHGCCASLRDYCIPVQTAKPHSCSYNDTEQQSCRGHFQGPRHGCCASLRGYCRPVQTAEPHRTNCSDKRGHHQLMIAVTSEAITSLPYRAAKLQRAVSGS